MLNSDCIPALLLENTDQYNPPVPPALGARGNGNDTRRMCRLQTLASLVSYLSLSESESRGMWALRKKLLVKRRRDWGGGGCHHVSLSALKGSGALFQTFPNMASGFVVKLDTCLTPPTKSGLKSGRHVHLYSDGINWGSWMVIQTPQGFQTFLEMCEFVWLLLQFCWSQWTGSMITRALYLLYD